MKSKDFDAFLEETFDGIRSVLSNKATEYAGEDDRLANFKRAAALQKISPLRALTGMRTKHEISLQDMLASDREHPLAMWDEKLGDDINYLILMRALLYEHLYAESAEPDAREPDPNAQWDSAISPDQETVDLGWHTTPLGPNADVTPSYPAGMRGLTGIPDPALMNGPVGPHEATLINEAAKTRDSEHRLEILEARGLRPRNLQQ